MQCLNIAAIMLQSEIFTITLMMRKAGIRTTAHLILQSNQVRFLALQTNANAIDRRHTGALLSCDFRQTGVFFLYAAEI